MARNLPAIALALHDRQPYRQRKPPMHPHSADSTEKLVERQRLMARALAVILAPDFLEGDGLSTDAIDMKADAPTAGHNSSEETADAPMSSGKEAGCHNG
jgi:hypothetical protein